MVTYYSLLDGLCTDYRTVHDADPVDVRRQRPCLEASLSRSIARLEDRGLVERKTCIMTDGRVRRCVYITELGKAALTDIADGGKKESAKAALTDSQTHTEQ